MANRQKKTGHRPTLKSPQTASGIAKDKRSEKALLKSEERYRDLLEMTSDWVWEVDENAVYTYVSPKIRDILGYEPEEVLGKTPLDLMPPDEAQRVATFFGSYVAEHKPFSSLENVILHKTGRLVIFETSGVPIFDQNGTFRGYRGIDRDITQRKQSEEAMENLRRQRELFLNSAGEGILGLDPQGNHTFVNPAAAKMLGYKVEELIGQSSHAIWHHSKPDGSPYPEEECPIHEAYKDGVIHRKDDEVFWRKDGTSFPVRYTSTPIVEADKLIGAVVIFRDITERKQAEKQIKHQLQRLSALREIDRAINSSLDLHITLKIFLDELVRHLQVDAAAVLLLNPYTQTLEFGAGRGFHSKTVERTRVYLGEGHAGRAALKRRIIKIPNLSEATGDLSRFTLIADEGFVTCYALPLIAKGQVKGVLEIFQRTLLDPGHEWLNFLEALAGQAAIAVDNAELFNSMQRANLELTLAYDTTLEGWSRALDMRDKETEGHTQRVTEMTLLLARTMKISEAETVHIRRGALLHDIGKMGVPDSILQKPGPLTNEEWEIMRKHPVYAYEMLSPIHFLRPALDIPYCHHEKWDGTGYPRGLTGELIPLAARFFAVVDVWDALRSDRPYRPAWPEDKVREHVRQLAGKDFDPKVVEVFLEAEKEW